MNERVYVKMEENLPMANSEWCVYMHESQYNFTDTKCLRKGIY